MIIGVILASGSGTRTKLAIPKQFAELDGRTILEHSIEKFLKSKCDKLIVTLPEKDYKFWEGNFKNIFKSKKIHFIPGGKTRQESLVAAIAKGFMLTENKNFKVVSHDSARPFVSLDLINAHVEKIAKSKAVNTIVEVNDTIVELNKTRSKISKQLNRSVLGAVQTPQSFDATTYIDLLVGNKKEYTDAIGVFVDGDVQVKIIEGEHTNIKITTDQDVAWLSKQ